VGRTTGEPLEEVRASLEYDDGSTDDPGDIVLPELPDLDVPTDEFEALGVTWQLTNGTDPGIVRDGPPG